MITEEFNFLKKAQPGTANAVFTKQAISLKQNHQKTECPQAVLMQTP